MLRTYKLGEADQIVVLFGRSSGQIRAVAKGIRRTTSRFGARLAPFNLVDLQLYRGRNLDTVTQAQIISAYSAPLASDYDAFTGAKIVVETIQKLTEGVEGLGDSYFRLLHGALGALAARRHPVSLSTASFLLRIMKESGWEPILEECAQCGAHPTHCHFAVEAGGLACYDCAPSGAPELSEAGRLQLVALMEGNWAHAEKLPHYSWDEASRMAGLWTQWHLEQRLKSLPFLSTTDRAFLSTTDRAFLSTTDWVPINKR